MAWAPWSKEHYARQAAAAEEEERRRYEERRAQQERMYRRIEEDRQYRLEANPHSRLNRARDIQAERTADMQIKQRKAQIVETYTQQQKMEQSRLQNINQSIDQSPDLDNWQKTYAKKAALLKYAGAYDPTILVQDLPEFPNGHAPGELWKDEAGNTFRNNPDGRPDLVMSFKDTREHYQMQMYLERARELSKARMDMLRVGGFVDDDRGNKVWQSAYKPDQIEQQLQSMFPDYQQIMSMGQAAGFTPEGALAAPPMPTGGGVSMPTGQGGPMMTEYSSQLGQPTQVVRTNDPAIQAMEAARASMAQYTPQQRASGDYAPESVQQARKVLQELSGEDPISRMQATGLSPASVNYNARRKREAEKVIREYNNGLLQSKAQKAMDETLPHPRTEAEFNNLKPGQWYIDPLGQKRQK